MLPPIPEFQPSTQLLESMVAKTDVALITLGRNSGEFFDRALEDFSLSEAEQALISRVSDAYHRQGKQVVVILNIGNVIETASWRDKVDAIVLPWQGGQEAGNAVADVLSGKVNPSGKLPTSFPMQYSDVPSAERFPGYATSDEVVTDRYSGFFKGKWSQLDYEEGIYLGYRYYDKFDIATAYEFGYGLSYTEFSHSHLQIEEGGEAGHFTLSVKITNTGEVAGKDVVQLYISAPEVKLDKPVKELKGFVKTALLEPGQSQRVTFSVSPRNLASFDTQRRGWVAEAGTYTFHIGQSSEKFSLAKKINLKQTIIAEKVKTALQTQKPFDELTGKSRSGM